MQSTVFGLTVTEPLVAWLDKADSLDEVARTNQLRQLVSVLRDEVVSRKTEFEPDRTQVRSVDGIVFAGECVEGAASTHLDLVFARLLFFVLTRRHAKTPVDWLRQRATCGLSPLAIATLDALFVGPSHPAIGEVDLCPADLYAKPVPVPEQEQEQEQPVEEKADEEEEEEGNEESEGEQQEASVPVPLQAVHRVPIVPACRSFKQRWGTLIAIAGLALFVYGLSCGFARVQDVRAIQLQAQLDHAVAANRDLRWRYDIMAGEHRRLKREVDRQIYLHAQSEQECNERAGLAQKRTQIIEQGNAELATRLAQAQQQLVETLKTRQNEASCAATVAQLERQIADLQSRVDFGKVLQQVRAQTSNVFGVVSSLWNKHAPDAAAITASYEKLARKVEQLAAKWSEGSENHGEQPCACASEKGKLQVLRGDYDACMNELYRVRNLNK